jgi:hypothetical protein
MRRLVRRKLAMAGRALGFVRGHPSTDASWAGVVGRLEELLTRARELEATEREGRSDRRTATAARRALRERIQAEMLRHLVTTAGEAFKGEVAVPGEYRLPALNGPFRTFGAAARELHAAALPVRDRLVVAGLGETLLDDLAQALAEFDAAGAAADAARVVHVTARAGLEEVTEQVMVQVRLLDGLLRPRFRREPGLREAWESASSVDGPIVAARRPAGPVVGQIGPAPGNEVLLAPAAEAVTPVQEVPQSVEEPAAPPDDEGRRDVA